MPKTVISPSWKLSQSSRPKRRLAEVDFVPASTTPPTSNSSHKKQRVGPSASTIPRTLPMQPHEELLEELNGKYSLATTSVISSSKINNKVTRVLSHLGHVDLFNQSSIPGVIMLHARANDANKMVTVIELAKRRMNEVGEVWYEYNRLYEVHEENGGRSKRLAEADDRTVIEDTVMGAREEGSDSNEGDDFEPVETAFERAVRDKPATESKTTYMSILLSRVPIPELQSKEGVTLQTNANDINPSRRCKV